MQVKQSGLLLVCANEAAVKNFLVFGWVLKGKFVKECGLKRIVLEVMRFSEGLTADRRLLTGA